MKKIFLYSTAFFIVGFFGGLIIHYSSAQMEIFSQQDQEQNFIVSQTSEENFLPNKLFDDVSNDARKKGISQRQSDMTILYGKLDYLSAQLDNIQNSCGR